MSLASVRFTVLQATAGVSLRYDGIRNDHFVVNVVLYLAVKEFGKSISILQLLCLVFFDLVYKN